MQLAFLTKKRQDVSNVLINDGQMSLIRNKIVKKL